MAANTFGVIFTVLIVGTSLAGCGQGELSCDGATDAVMGTIKEHPPTQLLTMAASNEIQQKQQELASKFDIGQKAQQAECDRIADRDWVSDFVAAFPSYQPRPTTKSDDHSTCLAMSNAYVRANSNGYNNQEVSLAEQKLLDKCLSLSDLSGHADWTACNASLKEVDEKHTTIIDKIAEGAYAAAVYTLVAIRMESRNNTTGAVVCNAQLRAEIPEFGSAEESIEYKVEHTTDGQIYVSVQGAD